MGLSPKRRLDELLFAQMTGTPLPDFVAGRRPEASWRSIAAEIYAATDGEVSTSDVTLISWYGEDTKDSAA